MRVAVAKQFGAVEGIKLGIGYLGPPPVQVYAFRVDGLLIDTGPPILQREFMGWLEEQLIEQVFITHHHEDHSGNVNPIAQKHSTAIFGSPLCSELVQGKVGTCLPQRMYWGTPRYTNKVISFSNTTLETEKHRFELIAIPGHCPDQIALYEPNEGWLFSADAFVSPIIKYFMREESMYEQITSLKKLVALDFEALFCSHNPLMEGGKEKLNQKIQFFENFYGQVVYWANQGITPRAIMRQIEQKENWTQRFLTGGKMSARNMVLSVLRDEAIRR